MMYVIIRMNAVIIPSSDPFEFAHGNIIPSENMPNVGPNIIPSRLDVAGRILPMFSTANTNAYDTIPSRKVLIFDMRESCE